MAQYGCHLASPAAFLLSDGQMFRIKIPNLGISLFTVMSALTIASGTPGPHAYKPIPFPFVDAAAKHRPWWAHTWWGKRTTRVNVSIVLLLLLFMVWKALSP